MNEVRWFAACARAGCHLTEGEVRSLSSLDAGLWRTARCGPRDVFTLAEDLHLHNTDTGKLPVSRLSATQAKTLLAALVVTSDNTPHPFPGRWGCFRDLLTICGGPLLGDQAAAHIKGAVRKLYTWGLLELDLDGCEVPDVDDRTRLRMGPAAQLWTGPWVAELSTLVSEVAESRGWSR